MPSSNAGNSGRFAGLMYHEVGGMPARGPERRLSPHYVVETAAFEAQMAALHAARVRTLSLSEVLAGEVSGPATLVTFDDGLEGNLHNALPVLQRHAQRATVFVAVGFVGSEGHLDWEGLRALVAGGVEVHSHTWSHRPLQTLVDAEVRDELRRSRRDLEDGLGVPVFAASFPHGSFDARTVRIAAEEGYRLLCTSEARLNRAHAPGEGAGTGPMLVGRFAMTSSMTVRQFERLVAGQALAVLPVRSGQLARKTVKRLIGIQTYRRLYRLVFGIREPEHPVPHA
ncbi:MAG: polysaccharide deacetylase family protein [Gammaproteobacteria bacterium]|nr:polysaccharide deacetylase family protein [Gammaproteobacteria bacterium]